MKIEALIELADSQIPLKEKVEKVNSNRLELAILFLLLDQPDVFKEIFQVREVVENLNVLKPYLHERINKTLFESLSKIDEFILKCLQDPELFQTFNDLTQGNVIKQLSWSLKESHGSLIKKVIQLDLLPVYMTHSIFDNGFLTGKLDNPEFQKLVLFLEENSSYFTPEYFASLESLPDQLFEVVLPKLLKHYANDFEGFYKEFHEQFNFTKETHTALLTDANYREILSKPRLLEIVLPGDNHHKDFPNVFEKMVSLGIDALPQTLSGKLVKRLIKSADDDKAGYARLMVNRFSKKVIADLFVGTYDMPTIFRVIFDQINIESGDFSSVDKAERFNDFDLTDEQIIDVIVKKAQEEDEYYIYDLKTLKNFERIKLPLANALLKVKTLKEDYLFDFKLETSWYLENLGIDAVLKNKLSDLEENRELLQELKVKYHKEIKEFFWKKLSQNTYYHRANNELQILCEEGLCSPTKIFNLMKKNDLSHDTFFLDFISKEQFEILKSAAGSDSRSSFLSSKHIDSKDVNSIINKMNSYDLYNYHLDDWINLPLNQKQLQKIWDKIKEGKSAKIKDAMFAMLEKQKDAMSEELYQEIYDRSKKLKGFEDSVTVTEEESGSNLDKKFTKAISSPLQAFQTLGQAEFEPLLNQKNLIRIAKKISTDTSFIQKWMTNPKLALLIDDEVLEVLLAKTDFRTVHAYCLYLPNVSDNAKITHLSTVNSDSNFHLEKKAEEIDFSLPLFSFIIGRFKDISTFISLATQESVDRLVDSDEWAKIKLIDLDNEDDADPLFTEEEVISQLPNMPDWARTRFLQSYLTHPKVSNLSVDMADQLLAYIPEEVRDFTEGNSSSRVTDVVFRKFVTAFTDLKTNINFIIERKKAFTSSEFETLLENVSSEQIEKATNYSSLGLHYLSDREIDILLSEKNLDKVPASYWAARHLLSATPLTPQHLEAFFLGKNGRGDAALAVSKLAFMSSEEKETLLKKIQKTEMSLGTMIAIMDNNALLGYSVEQLEPLVFNLNSASIGKLFSQFEEYSRYFSNMSEETRIKILERLVEKDAPIEQVQKLLVLLPQHHPLREQLIAGCRTAREIERLLGMQDLTTNELEIIGGLIISHSLDVYLSYAKSEYMGVLLNRLLSNHFWNYAESSSEIIIESGNMKVGTISKKEIDIIPMVSTKNRELLINHFKHLMTSYPEKITGTFIINESRFVPDTEVPDEVMPSLSDLKDLSSSFGSSEEVTKAVMRFSKVVKLKAIATRRLNNGDRPNYRVELVLDESLVKSRTKPVNEEILTLLNKQEQSLKSFLDKSLTLNQSRTFGFELEFSSNRAMATVANKMRDAALSPVSVKNEYVSSSGKTWDLKVDGSVKAVNGYSMELASPILEGDEGIKETRTVLKSIFSNFEIVTGQSTNGGLHVHHDIKDLLKVTKDGSEIVKHFYPFQESLYSLCDSWRQTNSFCKRIEIDQFKEESRSSISRDVGFNVTDFGTMEFRMRESLQDVETIVRWIQLTQKVVESAALSLKDKTQKFQEEATLTLDLITHEKVLQMKAIEDNNTVLEQINRFSQAKLYSEMALQK